jgi:hypothetical protein
MKAERSQSILPLPIRDAQPSTDDISELLLDPTFIETLASKLRDMLLPLPSTQKPISSPPPGVPFTCWNCKKYGHKKIHCPDLSCYYCGKRGHCKRICLSYRLSVWYNREQNILERTHINAKPLSFQNKQPSRVIEDSNRKYPTKFVQSIQTDIPHSSCIQPLIPNNNGISDAQQISVHSDKKTKRGKRTTSRSNLNKHTRVDQASSLPLIVPRYIGRKTCYKCPKCECAFMERHNLVKHLQQSHNTDNKKCHQIYIHSTSNVCGRCQKAHIFNRNGNYETACLRGGNLCVECIAKFLEFKECDECYYIDCPLCGSTHNIPVPEGVLIEVLVGQLTDDILVEYG